jgi:hypothetical protein
MLIDTPLGQTPESTGMSLLFLTPRLGARVAAGAREQACGDFSVVPIEHRADRPLLVGCAN